MTLQYNAIGDRYHIKQGKEESARVVGWDLHAVIFERRAGGGLAQQRCV